MKTRLFLTISFLCAFTLTSLAQEKMKILLKNGSAIDYFVEDIEEVSFETDAEEDEPSSGPLQLKMNATSFKHKGLCEPIIETITAEQMNHIYSVLNVSKKEFTEEYKFVESAIYNGEQVFSSTLGTDNYVTYNPNVSLDDITTTGLTWYISADYKRKNPGLCPKATAVFVKKLNGLAQKIVVIHLISSVPFPAYEPSSQEDYQLATKISSYWTEDPSWGKEDEIAQINAFVPGVNETDENKAVFVKDLQDLFATKITDGIANNISKDYKKGNNNVIENNVHLRFKSAECDSYQINVSNKGTELVCNGETIASLDGTRFKLNKASNIAKEILNTNKLYITYTFYATYITECMDEEEVPNNGYPEFTTRLICPVTASKPQEGNFEDGLDFGTYDFKSFHTTILPASNVIKITDWRGIEIKKEDYLYSYYGIKKVTCDNDRITTDINSPGTNSRTLLKDLKNSKGEQTLQAGIVNANAWADPNLQGGFLYAFGPDHLNIPQEDTYDEYFYYKNNGAVVTQSFNLFFPISIEYTWGTLNMTVKATVMPTYHINVHVE